MSNYYDFQYLPEDIIFHILSYLDVKSLCRICCTSKRLYLLSGDDYIWKKKLDNDRFLWKSLGCETNPEFYRTKFNHSITNKEVYIRCLPEYQEYIKNSSNNDYSLNSMLSLFKSFFRGKIPKVALTGPGLESETSMFVANLMSDSSINPLKIINMFPGYQGGVGSGFTYELKERQYSFCSRLNLSFIYSLAKKDRKILGNSYNRLSSSLLMTDTIDEAGESTFELTDSARVFFQSMDAVIYSVDSGIIDKQLWHTYYQELNLIRQASKAPILILALSIDECSRRKVSCIDIIDLLRLNEIEYPANKWEVMQSTVMNMSNLQMAFTWILRNCSS